MNLLAWLTGTWKSGAWKDGAWQSGETIAPPLNLPGYGHRPQPRRPQEDDEAFLIAALL